MVKLFTHNDMDCVGCGILAKLAFGNEVDVEYCDYDNINENVMNYLNSNDDNASDELILSIKQKEIDDYVEQKNEQIIFTELCGRECGYVFAEKYVSELGNRLCKLHPEIDFIVMIDMGNKTVSYRAVKEDIDLGKDVAQLFGGGGHPKAAGSEFSKEIQLKTIEEIFR